jgi:glycosyltransferase involved in cell wall biosynthesis
MSKPTVAVTLIVAAGSDKEAISLARCLGSFNGYVDAIYIQLNSRKGVPINPKMRQIAESFTDKIFIYEWEDNFVNARNHIFSKVPKKYDWIGWVDSDDIIENPEKIKEVLAVIPQDTNGLYINYDYQRDEFGNTVVSHWVARFVRNNDSFAWKSSFDDDEVSVHETLVPKHSSKSLSNNEFQIIHMADPDHYKESLIRNISLLEGMCEGQSTRPDGVDPRILYYLGSHYYEAYRFREAKELFYQYLKLSGWEEERSEAHTYMGKILKMEGNLAGARNAFLMAMGEYHDNPGPYLELAKLEAKEQRWQQSANWAKDGISIKSKITTMVKYNYDFELYTVYAEALTNLGGKSLTLALKMAQKALKLRPFDPSAQENRDNVQKLVEYRSNIRSVARLFRNLRESKEEDKILPLIDSLPSELTDSPIVTTMRQQYTPPKKWERKSIAIYVGHGPLGTWNPNNLNNGGLGGSEEAIIRLSNELVKLEWKVTVYATPGTEVGTYNNVEWKHYWEFNPKDKFDVLISWRQPGFFDTKYKARKKYLWLHDVIEKNELTPQRLKNLDKVIYVSKYHSERPESEHVSDKQKFPSANGITPGDFKYDNTFERDLHRCIYMSANERGLRILYDIWPEVKREVPDATLDVYYGWHSFDAVNRDNPERMAWKASMVLKAKELDGVTERGRIGQDELNQEIFKSGIWAYPSFFPEVSCITSMKAQAAGAWPITSTFAALEDNVLYGEKIDMGKFEQKDVDRYKEALIHWLNNPPTEKERQEMMVEARDRFSWLEVAKQWDEEMS